MGDVDGGLSPFARAAFERWIIAIREELGARVHSGNRSDMVNILDVEKLTQAFSEASPYFEDYVAMRNYGEFLMAGRVDALFPKARDYAHFLLRASKALSYDGGKLYSDEMANTWLADIEAFVGKEYVAEAAERLMKVEYLASGSVDPQSLPKAAHGYMGISTHSAFQYLIADASPLGYIFTQIASFGDDTGSPKKFSQPIENMLRFRQKLGRARPCN